MQIQDDIGRRLIPAPQARREKLGGITKPTLWRWMKDKSLGMPAPIRINGRNFFDIDELDRWIAARQEGGA